MNGPDAPPNVGNCLPLRNIPLGMAVHNIEMQPGRGGRLCRSAGTQRHADRPRSRLGPDHAAQRRNPPHPVGLPGEDRPDRQLRPHEHRHRQGGPQPLEGHSAARPRHRDEPDRSSARRRRRPHQGRPPPGEPDGQERQGRPTRKRRKPSNSAIVRRRRSRRYGQIKIQ